jgi:hypothetical protein
MATQTRRRNEMSNATKTRPTIEEYVAARANRAEEDYLDTKAAFAADFERDPKSAIEWKAGPMVVAETTYVWWTRLVKRMAKMPVAQAIAEAREEAADAVRGFFGSNSTCLWKNASDRATAEAHNDILHRAVRDLEHAIKHAAENA